VNSSTVVSFVLCVSVLRTYDAVALEVITELLPLDIHIKQVAMTTSYRINSLKNWKRVQKCWIALSYTGEDAQRSAFYGNERGSHEDMFSI